MSTKKTTTEKKEWPHRDKSLERIAKAMEDIAWTLERLEKALTPPISCFDRQREPE